jgi:phosphopantothenoylcysteine decarboxylase/phosphopantothenate--cysteine ligase
MHDTMQNSIYKENLEHLTSKGVNMISPDYKWGKANYPGSHKVVVETIRALSKSKLKGKKIIVTGGPTPVWIDNVRYITNRFRGRSGIAIADEAYMRGADVKYIHGSSGIPVPNYLDCKVVRSFEEYLENVMKFTPGKDIGIFSAAVADYMPIEKKEGKLPSKGALNTLAMKNTVKVIDAVKEKWPELFMVSFKYEEKLSEESLIDIAKGRIAKGHKIVVANRGEEMEKTKHSSIIVTENNVPVKTSSKQETAFKLLDIIEQSFSK